MIKLNKFSKLIIFTFCFIIGQKGFSQTEFKVFKETFQEIESGISINDTMFYSGIKIDDLSIEKYLCQSSNYCLYKDGVGKVNYRALFRFNIDSNLISLIYSTFEFPFYAKIWIEIINTQTGQIISNLLLGASDPSDRFKMDFSISDDKQINLTKLYNLQGMEPPISDNKEIIHIIQDSEVFTILKTGQFKKISSDKSQSYKAKMIFIDSTSTIKYEILEKY